jgi:excisionase family DNA binding protein
MATDAELAYCGGVVDSDGYIGIHRSTYAMRVRGDATQPIYQARVQVKQVEPQAIDLLFNIFGGHRYVGAATAAKGRPLAVWQVHSAACAPILTALMPHLRIKRAQAENALELTGLQGIGRRFEVPDVVDGEPMMTMAEAARALNKSYDVVMQAVRNGSVPHVRTGPRMVLIPASYIPIWAARGSSPKRSAEVTEKMESLFLRAKELNRTGI